MKKGKIILIALLVVVLACMGFLVYQISDAYSDAKRVTAPKIDTEPIVFDEQTPEVNQEQNNVSENTYKSPYNEDYGKSLETIFVDAIQNKENNVYKSIMTNCEILGYQLQLSTTNGYTITSRGSSIDTLNIYVDNTTDSVKSAKLEYAGMLSITYNPNSTKGEYIFENTEQGKVEYFTSVIEATDTLLSEINYHRYDPSAVLLINEDRGIDWVNSVTPATDTSSYTGYEDINEVVVPAYFDANYYQLANPDVVAVLGTDPRELYRHYITHGRAEGRQYAANTSQVTPVQNVYITSMGNHYHKNNCKYIDGDANEVSINYATANGYQKCPICNP